MQENTFLCASSDVTKNVFLPDADHSVFFLSDGLVTRQFHNVCTHKGCKLVNSSTDKAALKCDMHGWAFDLDGSFLSGRGFKPSESLNLKATNTHQCFNAHFKYPLFIDDLPTEYLELFNFSNFVKEKTITEELKYSADIYMEIFFDLYHVKAIHDGLRNYVDPQFEWSYGDNWIIQKAKKKKQVVGDYSLFDELLGKNATETGSVWLGLYPNIMIELYQKAIVVSQVFGISKNSSRNVRTYYFHRDVADNSQLKEAFITAWETTDKEDDEFGKKLQEGRNWCANLPIEFVDHPTEEQGHQHYIQWCKKNNFRFNMEAK